jgi:hypothetical protein
MLSLRGDGIYLSGISIFQDGASQPPAHTEIMYSLSTHKNMFSWSPKFGVLLTLWLQPRASMTRGSAGVMGGATAIRGAAMTGG